MAKGTVWRNMKYRFPDPLLHFKPPAHEEWGGRAGDVRDISMLGIKAQSIESVRSPSTKRIESCGDSEEQSPCSY